jgi:hypothetical protein
VHVYKGVAPNLRPSCMSHLAQLSVNRRSDASSHDRKLSLSSLNFARGLIYERWSASNRPVVDATRQKSMILPH